MPKSVIIYQVMLKNGVGIGVEMMKKLFAVGPDFVLDTIVTFPNLANFKKFAVAYSGPFSEHIRIGCKTVSAGRGDEVVIDGKESEARELVEHAAAFGADVRISLGGNGAQEAATLAALGCKVFFLGGYSNNQLLELPPKDLRLFGKVDLSFASVSEMHKSLSVIFQAPGTNRYILNDGRGRRVGRLAPYLQKLPDALREITQKYGKLDAVGLVGFHGLFATGIRDHDYRMMKDVINKVRGTNGPLLFTDAGSLAAFTAEQRRLLFKIYSLFDILSVNEDELAQICRAVGISTKDKLRGMSKLLKSSEKLSTIWLHAPHYQASVSTKYGAELLEKAQTFAAAAGVCRVEKGSYPTIKQINSRVKSRDCPETGQRFVSDVARKYGNKIDGAGLAVTPCYRARDFVSSVGAGDAATAAYAFSLVSYAQKSQK